MGKYIEAEEQGASFKILYFAVKQGVAHELKKYIVAEQQGGADWKILYFPVKQGVAHELRNILKPSNRVGPNFIIIPLFIT